MAKGVTKEFKKCYNRTTGKIKSLAPAVYNNKVMMSRLGWEIMPEIDSNETKEMLPQSAPAKAPEKISQDIPKEMPKQVTPKEAPPKQTPQKTPPKNTGKRNPQKQA